MPVEITRERLFCLGVRSSRAALELGWPVSRGLGSNEAAKNEAAKNVSNPCAEHVV